MNDLNPSQANAIDARDSLFMSTDGQPYVTSRAVAERFGKRHKDVLKAIKNELHDSPDPAFDGRNIAPVNYRDSKGELRPEYHLTEEGFALIVVGFTGRKAKAWRRAYITAFADTKAELKAKDQLYLDEYDQRCPCLRVVVEATLQGLNRQQIAKMIGKSVDAVTYWRREARRMGLLPPLKLRLVAPPRPDWLALCCPIANVQLMAAAE